MAPKPSDSGKEARRPAWRWRPLPGTTLAAVVGGLHGGDSERQLRPGAPLRSQGPRAELSLRSPRDRRRPEPRQSLRSPGPAEGGRRPGPAEHRQGRAPSPPWAPATRRLPAPCVWGGRPAHRTGPHSGPGRGASSGPTAGLQPLPLTVTPDPTAGPSRGPGQRPRPRSLAPGSVWLRPSLGSVLDDICFPQHFRPGGWRVARAQPAPAWPAPRATPQPGH